MIKKMKDSVKAEWALRIAVFGSFLGHGVFALQGKESWIPYFTSVGISESMAATLLPLIGTMDVVVALFALFYPIRAVLAWATVWGFATALIRPISGEPIWDFVERAANWGAPLALLYLKGIPKKAKEWFR
tara:strand:- start:2171 stop:2563 length:393 start_codon:yes stop_codon:yes gene_type:complete